MHLEPLLFDCHTTLHQSGKYRLLEVCYFNMQCSQLLLVGYVSITRRNWQANGKDNSIYLTHNLKSHKHIVPQVNRRIGDAMIVC